MEHADKMPCIIRVLKVWGYEKWFANTPEYCGKEIGVIKGYRCSIHHHKIKDETFYMLNGMIALELWDEQGQRKVRLMSQGDVQRVLPGQEHRFTGLEDSVFIEVSTHHEDSDSYRSVVAGQASVEEISNLRQELRVS